MKTGTLIECFDVSKAFGSKLALNRVNLSVDVYKRQMLDEHYIQWVCLETKKGSQMKYLKPGEKPEAEFVLDNDEIVAVYEYCNLHGLWKA